MTHSRSVVLGVAIVMVAALCDLTAAAAVPATDASTWLTATIPLPNRGLAYDAAHDKLLVSAASSVPTLGNHLVEIDPHTGALGRDVYVGADPTAIAVASDGSRAYVALDGAPSVAEVDLASFTVTRQIVLGSDSLGPLYAEDIEVQPNAPDVIAVSRRNQCCSPRHEGVAIYDDGVKRPTETAGHTGADRITWSDDPAILYGYNNETTGYGFYKLTVNASGVTLTSPGKLISGFYHDIEFGDGRVHATNGQVVDVSTLTLAGSYAVSGRVEIDDAQHKAFYLSGATLRRADIATQLTDWSRTVPNISPRDLVDASTVLAAAGSSSILLMGPGVSASGFALPPPPPSMVQTWAQHEATLTAQEIVSSPDGDHVYAVVRTSAPAHPGEVVEVDTSTGVIGRTLFVGSDPHRIAISADGSTLLVGHYAANKVTQVDIATFTATKIANLASDQWANDIAPRPGHSASFAVVVVNHCCSPALEGTLLVEDGVVRPNAGPGHTGGTSIAFASDPGRVYGHNGGTTDFGFYTMGVDATGITPLSDVGRLLEGFGLEIVSAGGRVYSSNGGIVDPTIPLKIGEVNASGQPVPVPSVDRLLLVGSTSIAEFSLSDFGAVGSLPFVGGTTVDAVLAGSQVAIATSGGEIVFVPLGPDSRTVPGVPTAASAVGGEGRATVSWIAPANNGGAPITGYTVTSSPGGMTCTTSATVCIVNGLANGTSYTFTVRATNTKGSGPSSAPTNSVTPIGRPTAPSALVATAGNASVSLSWTAPSTNGGSPVTGYTATASPGGATCTSASSACTVNGLTNGLPYVFTVRAANAIGPGAASLPTAPTIPTACDGSGTGPFIDVSAAHQFCADIEWAAANTFVAGYPDGNFRPTIGSSRQAVAAVLYRYRGEPPFSAPVFPSFVDVPVGHTFYVDIEWAYEQGLVNGFANGTFNPGAAVTRQSLAAMFYRLAGSPAFAAPAVATLADVPTSHPFFEEIEWLIDAGVTTGFSDGTFHPGESITRQALVAFLHRFDQQNLG